jgi:enoyl-CoA hydratase/carnithine racemase
MSNTLQIKIVKHSKAYWTATFDNPPINLVDFDTTSELQGLITQLETDKDVSVIVFDSADPDFFISHYDLTVDMTVMRNQAPGPSGMLPYLDVLTRLSRLPQLPSFL